MIKRAGMTSGAGSAALAAMLFVAGCQTDQPFGFLKSQPSEAGGTAASGAASSSTSTRLVERDVEAPGAFSTNEAGLWDGRPSLGGVWVAYPSVKDPERVIIRNPANGKFVIGALFRREADNPGPKLQVSSDAAAALGMLAGAPTKLSVVALRREEASTASTAAPSAAPTATATADTVSTQKLAPAANSAEPGAGRSTADTVKAASAAIAAGEAAKATTAKTAPAAAQPAPPSASARGGYIQLGIFSVEANAKRAATQAQKAGVTATVRTEESQGKTFWRVLSGPATDTAARDALLTKIKGLGYTDAYAVSK